MKLIIKFLREDDGRYIAEADYKGPEGGFYTAAYGSTWEVACRKVTRVVAKTLAEGRKRPAIGRHG